MSDLGPDGSDEELANHLRRRVGEEFRADAEEGERLAELARMRRRDLPALATEMRDRGDRVSLTIAGRTFVGLIVEVARDRCALDTMAGLVEVALGGPPVHLTVLESHAGDGIAGGAQAVSFRGRLHELQMHGVPVQIGTVGLAEPLAGTIAAVADDHLVVDDRDGRRWYVARSGLAYVVTGSSSG